MVVARGLVCSDYGSFPDLCASIGVEGVNAAMLRGHIQDIVVLTTNYHVTEIKRLRIHLAIHRMEADLSELDRIHVIWSQNCFRRIETVARNVVVKSSHIGRICRRRGHNC